MNAMFNLNDQVLVKLTQAGIDALKEQHDELNEYVVSNGGEPLREFRLTINEHGYTSFQAWDLISQLGYLFRMGQPEPFELNVILTKVHTHD